MREHETIALAAFAKNPLRTNSMLPAALSKGILCARSPFLFQAAAAVGRFLRNADRVSRRHGFRNHAMRPAG
jgi:hypothetical protein